MIIARYGPPHLTHCSTAFCCCCEVADRIHGRVADTRQIGKEQELFFFHDLSPGR